MADKLTTCKVCGAEIAAKAKACPKCGAKNKKPIYKRWWLWVLVIIAVIGIIGNGKNATVPETSSALSSEETIAQDATSTPAIVTEQDEPEQKIPTEYKSALKKAESYSDLMHMSKAAIYDQLVSEYGEQFPADAAQYAIDNLDADYYANALAKAKTYQENMNMSKAAIYDQLISDYGEKFTTEEAQYAVDNLE